MRSPEREMTTPRQCNDDPINSRIPRRPLYARDEDGDRSEIKC